MACSGQVSRFAQLLKSVQTGYALCTVCSFVAEKLKLTEDTGDTDASSSAPILIGCLLGIYIVKTVLGFLLLVKMYKVKGSRMELIVWMNRNVVCFSGEIVCVWWLQFKFETFGGVSYILVIILAVIGGSSVAFDGFYIFNLKRTKGKFKYYSNVPCMDRGG